MLSNVAVEREEKQLKVSYILIYVKSELVSALLYLLW